MKNKGGSREKSSTKGERESAVAEENERKGQQTKYQGPEEAKHL